jgi:metal-sulfur cluster biosynthetic enzyme
METKDKIIENLKHVYDPEISINVFDLGLIYDIDLEHLPKVTVTHTLTSAFCPAADDIVKDIHDATINVEEVESVDVITTFDPPFGPWNMSEEAKMILGVFE